MMADMAVGDGQEISPLIWAMAHQIETKWPALNGSPCSSHAILPLEFVVNDRQGPWLPCILHRGKEQLFYWKSAKKQNANCPN